MKKITVLIPCYNEEEGIKKVIKGIPVDKLGKLGFKTEIVVIDNNSTDKTSDIARKNGATVLFEPKKGKGNAMKLGFSYVNIDSDYVVMLDGDDTYKGYEIPRLIEPIDSGFCDVVIGSRLLGKVSDGAFKSSNRLVNWVYAFAVRSFYKANITDVLSGFFAWKREALDELKIHVNSDGFAIEMEMITKMVKMGQQIYSVPITYDVRQGESKISSLKDGIKISKMLIKNFKWSPSLPDTQGQLKAKKLAFVSDAIYQYNKGGKEKRLYDLTMRLSQRGYDVHIYTMKWWEGKNTRVENGVTLHAISKLYPLYFKERRSIKQGILFGLSCFKLLLEDWDEVDVDHMPFFPLYSVKIVCFLKNKKMHATWHEVWGKDYWKEYLGNLGILSYLVEKFSVKLPDKIISVSDHTSMRLRDDLKYKKQLYTISDGIDYYNIQKIKASKIKSDVIFAGRLLTHKNVDKLIKSIKLVRKEFPKIRVLILGDGPEMISLKNLSKKLELNENISFLGFLKNHDEVIALMKSSKVFVLPSTREGFGIVALEANASGIPVVTIDHEDNATRHLIKHGENGMITSLNESEIAASIIDLLKRGKLQMRYQDFVKIYDWEHVIEKLVGVYSL